jgi:hypothetical protein
MAAQKDSEPVESPWVNLLEWAEGYDWKPLGYDWNGVCEAQPTKTSLSLDPYTHRRYPLPALIDGEYDLEIEFTRREGSDGLCVFFPVGHQTLLLQLGHEAQGLTAVYCFGKNPGGADNPTTRRGTIIKQQNKHRVAIRVRRSGTEVTFEIDWDDAKNYITWSGDASELRLRDNPGGWKLTMIRRLWVGFGRSRATFHTIRARPHGDGTIRRDSITPADRSADREQGLVRLVGEQANGTTVGLWQFCVNQIPVEDDHVPEEVWPLVAREFEFCKDYYGVASPSRLKIPIPKQATSFTAVGYCDVSRSVSYKVVVDGIPVYDSGMASIVPVRVEFPPKSSLLELVIDDEGRDNRDFAYWCNPRFHALPVARLTEKQIEGKPGPLKFNISTSTVASNTLTRNQPIGTFNAGPLQFGDAVPCDEFLYSIPNASVSYAVPEGMTRFTAIGYCVVSQSVRFEVWADTKKIHSSNAAGIAPIDVKLPKGTKTIELRMDSLGDLTGDHAMWCYPRLTRK